MKNRKLIITESYWNQLRDHLIREDNLEWAAFAYLTKDSENPDLFFIKRIALCLSDAYAVQTPFFNSLTDEAQVELMNEIRKSDEDGIMEIHSHPFAKAGIFSGVDDANFPAFRNDILRRKANGFVLRMVIGRDESGFTCYYTNPQTGQEEDVTSINVIGRNSFKKIKRFSDRFSTTKISLQTSDRKFLRNIQVMGKKGQEAVNDITLGCVAAGGAMNPFIIEAAHAGFRKFVVVDFDLVEEINFNRLLGMSSSDLGKYKVDILYRELKRFDPDIEIKTIKTRFQDESAIKELKAADILVSGVDNDEARLSVQLFAARFMKPLFDMGSGIFLNDEHTKIEQKGSQTRIFIPGNACLVCQGLDVEKIHSETYLKNKRAAGYIINSNETPGSIITLNSTIASMTLSLLIDYVTGNNRIPLHLCYDELNYKMKSHNFELRADCNICGKNGIVGNGMEKTILTGGLEELPDADEIINSQFQTEESLEVDHE
jgi:molybdopterin-synthase adenylyltransferase